MFADHIIRQQMALSWSRKGTVWALSFDIQNAFGSVPFQELINCLRREYGIPECLLAWIAQYLENREQTVRVQEAVTNWRQVHGGVIQGSVVGPLLFIAYFDKGLGDNVGNGVSIEYADGLILLHLTNNASDAEEIQQTVDALSNSLQEKSRRLSTGKCNYVMISESPIPYVLPTDTLTLVLRLFSPLISSNI